MDKQEFIKVISEKRKGRLPSPREQAEMLDAALEVGNEILEGMKKLEADKQILADLNKYFPVIYKEAKRIFNKKPETT